MPMFDDFNELLDHHWTQTCIGGGKLYVENSMLRMAFESARQGQYTDAQIDDYGKLPRSKLRHCVPRRKPSGCGSRHGARPMLPNARK